MTRQGAQVVLIAELAVLMWEEMLPPLLLIFVGRHLLCITSYVCVCACEAFQSFG